jgi:uncharacterized membrane protein YidH (DUF202 family)
MSSPAYPAQNERTALAWQRTALSLMVASMLVLRLTVDALGAPALVGTGIAFPLALWVFVESRSRYRHHAGLRLRSRARGGRAGAALTSALVMLGGLELAAVMLT